MQFYYEKTYCHSAYGGELLKTRFGRSRPRPLSANAGDTMHLILRSTQAVGTRSFRHPRNYSRVEAIVRKFAERFRVKILDWANNHNHLHFQVQLTKRSAYAPFIRALTAALAMAIAGTSRWKKAKFKFWDSRPFTRITRSRHAAKRLAEYVRLNQLEAIGYRREDARRLLAASKPQKRIGPASGG